jgi:hypothetical protein
LWPGHTDARADIFHASAIPTIVVVRFLPLTGHRAATWQRVWGSLFTVFFVLKRCPQKTIEFFKIFGSLLKRKSGD